MLADRAKSFQRLHRQARKLVAGAAAVQKSMTGPASQTTQPRK